MQKIAKRARALVPAVKWPVLSGAKNLVGSRGIAQIIVKKQRTANSKPGDRFGLSLILRGRISWRPLSLQHFQNPVPAGFHSIGPV
jgi:hypothetical protein